MFGTDKNHTKLVWKAALYVAVAERAHAWSVEMMWECSKPLWGSDLELSHVCVLKMGHWRHPAGPAWPQWHAAGRLRGAGHAGSAGGGVRV